MTDQRADWLEWRRKGIGGSDVAAIVDLSPWTSPYSVWADKMGYVADDGENDAMIFGRRAEAMLAEWFHDETGLYVYGEQTWCSHPDLPWARCTIDGAISASPDDCPWPPVEIGEWKTTSLAPWDDVPAHYQCQAQWSMFVTGAERCHFGVLHGKRFRTYVLDRDPADITVLIDRVTAFYDDHIVTGTPPPIDGSNATKAALSAVHGPAEPGATVDVPDRLSDLWAERAQIKTDAKRLVDRCDEIDNELRDAIGSAEVAVCNGRPLYTYRTTRMPQRVLPPTEFRTIRPASRKDGA